MAICSSLLNIYLITLALVSFKLHQNLSPIKA
nr:MAG TPA: hypothetical protein [Caudoviricetes sp.]